MHQGSTDLMKRVLCSLTGLFLVIAPGLAQSGARTTDNKAPAPEDAPRPGQRGSDPSSGCGQDPPELGAFHQVSVDGRGTARDYAVKVPLSYQSSRPLALTFVFHAGGGNETSARSLGLQMAAGAAAASIFVFPEGTDFQGFGAGWDDSCTGYDMPFFDNMAAALETRYCVDKNRVFVAGFSWGCDFVTALACCRGDTIRAAAAASCSDEFGNPEDYRTYSNLACPVRNGAAIRFTHEIEWRRGLRGTFVRYDEQALPILRGVCEHV